MREAGLPIRSSPEERTARLRESATEDEQNDRADFLAAMDECGLPVRNARIKRGPMSPRRAMAEVGLRVAERQPVSVRHSGLSEAGQLLVKLAEAAEGDPGSGTPTLDDETCSTCSGSGVLAGDVCPHCGGSGFEPRDGDQGTPSSVSGQRRSKVSSDLRSATNQADVRPGYSDSPTSLSRFGGGTQDPVTREAERQHGLWNERVDEVMSLREAMTEVGVPLK